MNVYRIESKTNGLGPFQNRLTNHDDMDPPGPMSDGVFGSLRDYCDLVTDNPEELYAHSYGFKDKAQMKDWFDIERLVHFVKKDHVIAQYEVPDEKVKIGGHQCAFKKAEAKFKRWVPVRELKN